MAPHDRLSHLEPDTSFNQSNIALLGSDIDHHLKLDSSRTEPAWSAPGLGSEAGVWSWRVEDFKLVSWRQGDLRDGGFCEGDSYIVLKSVAPVPSKPEVLIHDIHFWLGCKTSQDESGVAAYKTVELDEFLGDGPVQHRHLQGTESSPFLALFRPHFLVAQGGFASGFHHVSPSTPDSLHLTAPRLWEINLVSPVGGGKKHVKILQVQAEGTSVRRENVYILDAGDRLVQWNGKDAHPLEKGAAAEAARSWVDGRGGKATLKVLDEGSGDTSFFLDLGVDSKDLPMRFPPKAVPPPLHVVAPQLYDLESSSNSLPVPFQRTLLNSSSILLISTTSSLFVWVGSAVAQQDSRTAILVSQRYLAAREDRDDLRGKGIVRVVEGSEGDAFWKSVA